MWKLFSINKKESLVDILKGYSEEELRKAIPKALYGYHLSANPCKRIITTSAETGGER
jgi:hypothetical protein